MWLDLWNFRIILINFNDRQNLFALSGARRNRMIFGFNTDIKHE